jgi:hypothetical protein
MSTQPTDRARLDASDNPFVGPRSFRTGETLYGRERELMDLRDVLIAQRIVLLYSPSGAGKSSLIEAALRPQLETDGFTVLPTMRVSHEAPAVSGLDVRNRYSLSTLMALGDGTVDGGAADFSVLNGRTLDDALARIEQRLTADGSRLPNLCLVFDQFEEVFTLDPTDGPAKDAFFTEVGVALRAPNRWALFSMREDFIAHLDAQLPKVPNRLRARYRLDLLGPDAARIAIREPTRANGVDFTVEAADHLIRDLRRVRVMRGGEAVFEEGPYVEPVQLQVVCHRLWNSLDR